MNRTKVHKEFTEELRTWLHRLCFDFWESAITARSDLIIPQKGIRFRSNLGNERCVFPFLESCHIRSRLRSVPVSTFAINHRKPFWIQLPVSFEPTWKPTIFNCHHITHLNIEDRSQDLTKPFPLFPHAGSILAWITANFPSGDRWPDTAQKRN
jgi:hypothetical protein